MTLLPLILAQAAVAPPPPPPPPPAIIEYGPSSGTQQHRFACGGRSGELRLKIDGGAPSVVALRVEGARIDGEALARLNASLAPMRYFRSVQALCLADWNDDRPPVLLVFLGWKTGMKGVGVGFQVDEDVRLFNPHDFAIYPP